MPSRWPLSRLVRLPLAQLADLVRAQVALAAAQARVLAHPRGRLVAIREPSTAGPPVGAGSRRRAEELSLAIGRVAEFGLFRPRCLARSLALQWLLRREGIPRSRVRIGVRRDERGFAAHAWVDLDGAPLGERADVLASLQPLPDAHMVSS